MIALRNLIVTGLMILTAASISATDFRVLPCPKKIVTPPTEGWIELFREDFSEFSNGTDNFPDETQLADDQWCLPDGYMASEGWTGFGLYEAGEAIALNYPSYGGFLNSPEISMQGLVRVTFRMKSLDPIGTGKVMVCRGGIANPKQIDNNASIRQFDTDGWQDYEFYFQNQYGDAAFVQINTLYMSPMKKGLVIDNLKIAYNPNYVPMINTASTISYGNDGFSIYWDLKKDQAYTDFLLSLYREVTSGCNVTADQNFSSWETDDEGLLPPSIDDWKIINMFSNHPGLCDVDGDRKLAIGHHDESIELPYNGGKFTALSFDYTNFIGDNPEAWGAQIIVEGWDGNNWIGIKSFGGYGMSNMETGHADFGAWEGAGPGEGETVVPAFRGLYSKIRFTCESANYGAMLLIDNVHYETLPSVELECVEQDRIVQDLHTEYSGLDMKENYVVGIKVRNDGNCSAEAYYAPYGIATPIVLEPTDITDKGYTANWEPVAKATSYLLTVSDCLKLTEAREGYVHASADFSGIEVGTDDYYAPVAIGNMESLADLREYIGEGWLGAGMVAINGALGCQGSFYPGRFGILSPELNFSANGGKFTFRANVWICDGSGLSIGINAGQTDSDMFYTGGDQEIVLKITGGSSHERVAIFSTDGAPFYLHDFSITQNLGEGDIVVFDSRTYTIPADETSCHVEALTVVGHDRAYEVSAYRKDFTRQAQSSFSDIMIVPDNASGIESAGSMKSCFLVNGLDLILNLGKETDVQVWDVSGTLIYSATHSMGITSISLPYCGLYILSVGSMTAKIAAK